MLWVQSQDRKKFIPNPKLLVQYDTGIWNIVDMETGSIMGSYDTEADARKVMNDIVKFMTVPSTSLNGSYEECEIKSLLLLQTAILPKIFIIPEEEK